MTIRTASARTRATLRRWAGGLLLAAAASIGAGAVHATGDATVNGAGVAGAAREGVMLVAWGDPRPGLRHAGDQRFSLALADGSRLPLDVGTRANEAVALFGQRVRVSGQMRPAAAGTRARFAVDRIEALGAAPPDRLAAQGGGPVVKRVIFLLVQFSDDTAVPHAPDFYDALTNPETPDPGYPTIPATINGFFLKNSYGALGWDGDVGGTGGVPATGWLTLPGTKATYAPCGWSDVCADLSKLFDDAVAAGEAAGINFTPYDNINIVLTNDLDCCAWGGGDIHNGKVYGVTWEPPWGQQTDTYGHEMGHSLGLPHSGWTYFAYDSHWDNMSRGAIADSEVCGTYTSANSGVLRNLSCVEPGAGYLGAYRDFLGWLPSANIHQTTNIAAAATVPVEASALPLGAAVKMIKVCLQGQSCTGAAAHYLTIESRIGSLGASSQFDNGIPGDGVLIHDFQRDRAAIGGGNPCYFNSASGWAVTIDAHPGDWSGPPGCTGADPLDDAHLGVGEWYLDATNRILVTNVARAGNSYSVMLEPLGSDNVPDAFSFDPELAGLGMILQSEAFNVAGIDGPTQITVVPGSDVTGKFIIGSGAASSAPGIVRPGDAVRVQLRSSRVLNSARTVTIDIGGEQATWTVTTSEAAIPNAFSFTDVTNAPKSTNTVTPYVTITGLTAPARISLSGTTAGFYQIQGSTYTNAPGTITNGQRVRLRQRSAAGGSAARSITLDIGGVRDTWTVTTGP